MRMRLLTSVILVLIGALAFLAWRQSTQPAQPEGGMPGAGGAATEVVPPAPADPGVQWTTPARWVEELASGMRLATYVIPAPKAGGEPAKCAVYYFGPGQGGGTDANIERWIGEFENPGTPKRRTYEVRGIPVAQVELSGTYLAHASGTGAAGGAAPGWTLLGAIAEGPQGALFFKLTGPSATVSPASREFDGLLASLRKK